MDRIDELYRICELLDDDIELAAIAMKELAGAKEKPYKLRKWIEDLNTGRISEYIDNIREMQEEQVRLWRVSKLHRQTTIFDFIMGDE